MFGTFNLLLTQSLDPDAQRYINAVELSDGQPLEHSVRFAINDFVRGCKWDGIWDSIKASCILTGARTLNGALQSLTGSNPTNLNFVSNDYNRKTGLKGNGSNKTLISNRNNNADPQNSHHLALWVTEPDTVNIINPGFIGTGGAAPGESAIGYAISSNPQQYFFRSRSSSAFETGVTTRTTGLHAISRNSSSNVNVRIGAFSGSFNLISETPKSMNIIVFGREAAPPTNSRISFYSIGENIDLSLLNARLSKLMSDINNSIP